MKLRKILKKVCLAILLSALFYVLSCAPSLKLVKDNFYGYDGLSSELTRLKTNFSDILYVESIGKTHEGRSVFVVKIGKDGLNRVDKPAIMAIFTEHSGEHDITNLAIGIIDYLAKNYGEDRRVTDLLNQIDVWILPMMDPDGVEYDLSGAVKPFSWHKNRRPTGEDTFGVNLNRNWGHIGERSIPEDLAEDLADKKGQDYAGENPFSENETQAVRDFLLGHRNIKIFIDYHSGYAGFLQGGTGCSSSISRNGEPDQETQNRCEEIIERFAKEISNPKDKRPAFVAVTKERDVAKIIKNYAPWYIRPFLPKKLPPAPPGVSGEWVYGELGIMAIGVEIFRDSGFFRGLPESMDELIENQVRGILFLLDILSEEI